MAARLHLPRDAVPCFPAGITVLLLPVYGTNRARPAWISSSHSGAVQDCVGFYLCSPPGEMSLIKHSLSSAGSAVFIGKSLLPWPAGTELGSSAGYRGDGQPFPWLESLPLWDVVVWEECGCRGGKPAQGRCLWRWLQLPKHTDLSLLPLSPWSGHIWRGQVEQKQSCC